MVALYPLLAYTYYLKYDEWIKSEEWTFVYCVLLFGGHALSFLITAWSTRANSKIAYNTVSWGIDSSMSVQAYQCRQRLWRMPPRSA